MKQSFPFSRSCRFALAAGIISFAGIGTAQTVTVDASNASPDGQTTFNTLHDAVASFATGTGSNAGNVAANVINVVQSLTPLIDKVNADADFTQGTPVTIDGDLTIQGATGLATIVGQPLSNTEQDLRISTIPVLPCFTWRQSVALTLKNIAFIPSDPTMQGLLIVKSRAIAGTNSTVNVEGCVFTANNGTNLPIITTGRETPAPDLTTAGVIALATNGDAIWAFSRFERGDLILNFKNTVIGSFSVPGAAHTSDGLIAYCNGDTSDLISCFTNINEGCVFSNIDGRAIQNPYGGYVNVNGTSTNPVVFREITSTVGAIWNYSDTTGVTQPTACSVNYARFYNLGGNAISESNARGFLSSLTNSVIANCASDGIALIASGTFPPDGQATDTITLDNDVIHNAGSGSTPGDIYAGSTTRNMIVTNSIFTGPGKNGIVNNGSGTFTVTNSILSLNGPNALVAQSVGNVILDGSDTDIQVDYVNMDDPFSPDFFKVQQSNVRDWSVY